MWTQEGREEVQVPAWISPPAQPGWVALAFCFGSVATGGSRGLAGLAEEPDIGGRVMDDSRKQPWRIEISGNWADGEDCSEQGKTLSVGATERECR